MPSPTLSDLTSSSYPPSPSPSPAQPSPLVLPPPLAASPSAASAEAALAPLSPPFTYPNYYPYPGAPFPQLLQPQHYNHHQLGFPPAPPFNPYLAGAGAYAFNPAFNPYLYPLNPFAQHNLPAAATHAPALPPPIAIAAPGSAGAGGATPAALGNYGIGAGLGGFGLGGLGATVGDHPAGGAPAPTPATITTAQPPATPQTPLWPLTQFPFPTHHDDAAPPAPPQVPALPSVIPAPPATPLVAHTSAPITPRRPTRTVSLPSSVPARPHPYARSRSLAGVSSTGTLLPALPITSASPLLLLQDIECTTRRCDAKPPRFKPTKEQYELLVKAYEENPYAAARAHPLTRRNPDMSARLELCRRLGGNVDQKTLQVWFQNRRSKARAKERSIEHRRGAAALKYADEGALRQLAGTDGEFPVWPR
ncbi:hypothetical protein Q8F55_000745 [Vanrija albida]|uniref:Homeobox domain-containing protein n=1 Tax=Vanrija albida TaxID=181172 RepID=A0ABR3QF51_9TREE